MLISNVVTDWLSAQFQKIMLWIDSVIYWAVSMVYQLFIKLATIRLFDNEFFGDFANRIYAILGVFMLFYLAYALLNALINPDKLTGDKGVSKIASNLVISLILLGLIPTIFDYAYRIQNYILSSNLIGAIILNTSTTNPNNTETETGAETARNEEAMIRFGDSMAFVVMNAFINPDNYNVYMADDYTWFNFKKDVLERSDYSALNGLGKATVYAQDEVGWQNRTDVVVDYYVVISTLVGAFLLYIIVSFTLDLGVRVIKFAFCQLIAPIPIIMRTMPGKKGTFDKWLKMTLSIYFEVFVRVAIMYIAVYFIQAIVTTEDIFAQFTGLQGKIALVIIILGIFAFAKQAPKMLSDMLGIESGNMKLGIGEKLKAGGFFAGGAMRGAGVTGLVRNGIGNVVNKWGSTRGFFNKAALLGGSALSSVAGASSGMFNAYRNGAKDAKNFGDMRKSASEGAKISSANKVQRDSYKASHGGTLGSIAGRFGDAGFSAMQWAGVTASTEALQKQVSMYDKGTSFKTQLEDIARKKDNYIKALAGQLEAVEKQVIDPNSSEYRNNPQAYQAAIKRRADQISDLKNRRDIAMAKWVNDKLNSKDDAEVEAVRNAFNTYVRENASDPSIRNMKLEGVAWQDSWNTLDQNGNPLNLSDAEIKSILDSVKNNATYLKNNKTLKENKEKATQELNERIIKEQQKKN